MVPHLLIWPVPGFRCVTIVKIPALPFLWKEKLSMLGRWGVAKGPRGDHSDRNHAMSISSPTSRSPETWHLYCTPYSVREILKDRSGGVVASSPLIVSSSLLPYLSRLSFLLLFYVLPSCLLYSLYLPSLFISFVFCLFSSVPFFHFPPVLFIFPFSFQPFLSPFFVCLFPNTIMAVTRTCEAVKKKHLLQTRKVWSFVWR